MSCSGKVSRTFDFLQSLYKRRVVSVSLSSSNRSNQQKWRFERSVSAVSVFPDPSHMQKRHSVFNQHVLLVGQQRTCRFDSLWQSLSPHSEKEVPLLLLTFFRQAENLVELLSRPAQTAMKFIDMTLLLNWHWIFACFRSCWKKSRKSRVFGWNVLVCQENKNSNLENFLPELNENPPTSS